MKRIKRFRDRTHAGVALAYKFRCYKDAKDTIVVGLARGGVPVAVSLSEKLNLPCSVFISRKISKPEDRRCALGAVTETGVVFLDEAMLSAEPWLSQRLRQYLEDEIRLRENDITRLRECYRGGQPLLDFRNKRLIIVDDGTFTGATFVGAAQSFRKLGVSRLIGGLPVAPEWCIEQIRPLIDELVVLFAPKRIEDLADYYNDFTDLSDEDVVNYLALRDNASKTATRMAA